MPGTQESIYNTNKSFVMSHSCNVYDSLPWGILRQQVGAHTSAVCYFCCLIGDHWTGGALEKLQGGHKLYKTQKYVRYRHSSRQSFFVLFSVA